jgi:hypothetical protein
MKTILSTILGNKKGLLSLVSEKTGKISFKRVASTMVIAWITTNVTPQKMTTTHAIIIISCLVSVLIPKIMTGEKSKSEKRG